ncbi:MAG: PKD repeat protein [Bacteroidia bacterium]|jgi:PKD repeat protein
MTKIYNRNWLFKKFKSMAVLGSLLIAGSASAQLSGTYTINSGAATSGSNYASFSALSTALQTSGVSGAVTINVVASSGPYSEQFYLDELSGASATNTITINGNGEKIRANSPIIELEGTDFITFDNLVIEQTGSVNNKMFLAYDDVEFVTINDCELIALTGSAYGSYPGYYSSTYIWFGNHNYYYQVPTDETTDITITNNTLWKGTSSVNGIGKNFGIMISNPSSFTDDQNVEISGNDIQDIGQYGIYTRHASGWNIENNIIHNDNNTNSTNCYGMYIYDYRFDGEEAVVINSNKIMNLTKNRSYAYMSVYGIFAYGYYGSIDFEITNNVMDLYGPYYIYGIYDYGYQATGEHNIIGNTIIMDGIVTYAYATHYGIYNYYAASGEVKNNIITDQTGSFGGRSSYLIYTYNPQCTFDNNNLDNSTMAGTSVSSGAHTGYNSGNQTTLADWQSSAGGANSIAVVPQFTDVANNDYKPQSIAMANKGAVTTFGNLLDLDGVTRNTSTPDIGALEYFVDVEIVSVDMTTAAQCGGYTESVKITVKNNGVASISDVPLQYSVSGGTAVQEVMTASLAGSGASATFTFTVEPDFYGTNAHVVTASVVGDDDVPSNSSANTTINTVVSPTGGELMMSSQFDGYFNVGSMGDPDVTVKDYISEYDITRPAAYPAAAPGVDYTYDLKAWDGGTDVTSQGFSLTGSDEVLTADPAVALAGTNLFMELTVTDLGTGCDTSFGRYMYIPHTPVPSFTSSDICLGDVAQFKNTSTLGGTNYIVTKWEFDDPNNDSTDNSAIKDGFWEYSTYGADVNVVMTVANGVYPKFEYSDSNTINVTPKPEIDFKVLNACEGSPITILDNTSTPTGSSIIYSWDFAGEYTSTSSTPSYTFATPGQRQITLSASSNGCNASLTKNAYQFEMPVADFTSAGECNFVDVEFTSSSTIENGANMGYSWDFAGSGISREENPAYAFATAGTKTVILTATSEFGCANSTSQTITLNESPEADFNWDAACNLTEINFAFTGSVPNGGSNSSYSWDFDGQATAGQPTPSYLFDKVGAKQVTLTVADLNGCSSSIVKEVKVVLQAVAGFSAKGFEATDVCEGDKAVFTNSSTVAAGDLSYSWNFGDNTPVSTDHSPTHTYTSPGVYSVTLNALVAGGCSDDIIVQVEVNEAPDASFTVTREGRTIKLDGPTGNDVYRWTFGDGASDITEDPTYTYNNIDNGTFELCLATEKGVCKSRDCEDVTINLAGISELTQNNDMINVYPNPSNGKFNVTVENAGDVVIVVGDILGNVLSVDVRDNLNGTYNVDMSAVANGVYFVQVKNGDFYATKRITVSK